MVGTQKHQPVSLYLHVAALTEELCNHLGKKRRLTFIECANDLNSMIDVAKIADLVLLMIDASFGFEMVTPPMRIWAGTRCAAQSRTATSRQRLSVVCFVNFKADMVVSFSRAIGALCRTH